MGETLLHRYGRVRVAQIVASFYRDVLRSSRLAHYFHDVPMSGLIEHQATFMAMVMGGPPAFSDEEIHIAHSRLGITDEDFEEMLRLLEVNLLKFEVEPEDTTQVVAGYRELQSQVVNSPEGSGRRR